VYAYSKYYRLGDFFNPNIKKALMIGGGAYSYPKDFLKKHPGAHLDVVEIDPGVTELAKKYFNLKDSSNLTIYHKDGRAFLNTATTTYDAVYGDAFHSYFDIPFQLTTLEAAQKIAGLLTPEGVYIINVNSALAGKGAQFLKAEIATLQKVFGSVYVFPVNSVADTTVLQNVMVVALKKNTAPDFTSASGEVADFLKHQLAIEVPQSTTILTDDYAPVEQYLLPLVKK
jgi:spermidine synthase